MATSFIWLAIIFLCLLFGLIGCFANKVPGPLFVLIACIIAHFAMPDGVVGWGTITLVAAIWILSYILNKKVLPKLAKKIQEYSKDATWGTTLGSVIGIIIMTVVSATNTGIFAAVLALIISFVILPYGFAYLFEFVKKKDAVLASKCAASAYVVYFLNTIVKLLALIFAIKAMFSGDEF